MLPCAGLRVEVIEGLGVGTATTHLDGPYELDLLTNRQGVVV